MNSLLVTLSTYLSLVYTNYIQPNSEEYTLPKNKTYNKDFSNDYLNYINLYPFRLRLLISGPLRSLIGYEF